MTEPVVQQVEAAAPEVKAEPPTGKPNEVTTEVWVPCGPVNGDQLKQAAIVSVRDAIPVVYDLNTEIVDSKKSVREKVDGRLYTIKVTYTPRGEGKVPVDLDKVVKGLEAPSLDAFHPGDPDFGKDA